jgi:hypothetical protein
MWVVGRALDAWLAFAIAIGGGAALLYTIR